MRLTDILILISIVIILIVLCKVETRDMNKILPQKVFQDGKLESLFDYTVYWRRSLIISIVILLLSLAVGIISFGHSLIFLVISMLVIYFQFNFYSYHQDKYIIKSFDCVYNPDKSLSISSIEKPFFSTYG